MMVDDFWDNPFSECFDGDEDIEWVREWVRLEQKYGPMAALFIMGGGKLVDSEGKVIHDFSKMRPNGNTGRPERRK